MRNGFAWWQCLCLFVTLHYIALPKSLLRATNTPCSALALAAISVECALPCTMWKFPSKFANYTFRKTGLGTRMEDFIASYYNVRCIQDSMNPWFSRRGGVTAVSQMLLCIYLGERDPKLLMDYEKMRR